MVQMLHKPILSPVKSVTGGKAAERRFHRHLIKSYRQISGLLWKIAGYVAD